AIDDNVLHFAQLASTNGADGVVCSVHEANRIKSIRGSSFQTVTPGIRLANAALDDQKRVATPAFARNNGADILVIGRSITQASDPNRAYQQAIKERENGIELCNCMIFISESRGIYLFTSLFYVDIRNQGTDLL